MTATKSVVPDGAKAAPKDAITLLRADHEDVNRMFAAYAHTRTGPAKKALVAEICKALTVHAQIEEEIFYPEVQTALKDKLLVPDAAVEHAGVKVLIAQLESAEPDGKTYDAQVQVLSEQVRRHVKEEQNEIFPQARSWSLDMMDLGTRMSARKEDLLDQAA